MGREKMASWVKPGIRVRANLSGWTSTIKKVDDLGVQLENGSYIMHESLAMGYRPEAREFTTPLNAG